MKLKNLRQMPKAQGFTLVELLISMAIIGVLTVMAVPSLLVSRMQANQVGAVAGLKTIAAAQTDWNTRYRYYTGDMNDFGRDDPRFLDKGLTGGYKQSYEYTLDAEPVANGINARWSSEAHPVLYRGTGVISYYIDEEGVIRGVDVAGAPADANAPAFQ